MLIQQELIKFFLVINFLLKKNSKIIIISHIGRPKGKINKDLSLKPVTKYLGQKINKTIKLVSDDIFKLNKKDLFQRP